VRFRPSERLPQFARIRALAIASVGLQLFRQALGQLNGWRVWRHYGVAVSGSEYKARGHARLTVLYARLPNGSPPCSDAWSGVAVVWVLRPEMAAKLVSQAAEEVVAALERVVAAVPRSRLTGGPLLQAQEIQTPTSCCLLFAYLKVAWHVGSFNVASPVGNGAPSGAAVDD
jgi:hypothetical protein